MFRSARLARPGPDPRPVSVRRAEGAAARSTLVAAVLLGALAISVAAAPAQGQGGPGPGGQAPGQSQAPGQAPGQGQGQGPGPGEREDGPAAIVRSALVGLLVKISMLHDAVSFDEPEPEAFGHIAEGLDPETTFGDSTAMTALIEDRVTGPARGLDAMGLLTPEMEAALAPFTEDELANLALDLSAPGIDPEPYDTALRQLMALRRIMRDDPGAVPRMEVLGTIPDDVDLDELDEDIDAVDLQRFVAGPSDNPAPAAPSTTAIVAVPTTLPAPPPPDGGLPPVALVGAGAAMMAFGGGALVLRARRRAAPGVSQADLLAAAGRLAGAGDAAHLRTEAAAVLCELVDGDDAVWFEATRTGLGAPARPIPTFGAAAAALAEDALLHAPGAVTGGGSPPPIGTPSPTAPAPSTLAVAVSDPHAPVAVLVVVRPASRPFGESESRTAEQVATIVATALANVDRLQSLESLAKADPLTGLGNRRAFDDDVAAVLQRSRDRNQPVCVVMADVDHFKSVNDRFGHAVGDAVLRVVAAALVEQAGDGGRAYRMGGEEFCVVLTSLDLTVDGGLAFAEALRRRVAGLDFVDHVADGSLAVTSSFGVAATIGGDAAEVLHRADSALYAAKGAGRNRVESG